MQQQVHFQIDGNFITELARERFYQNKNLKSAMDILLSATESDELSEQEHIHLCMDILAGNKRITGVYPGNDYGVTNDNLTPNYDTFIQNIQNAIQKSHNIEEEYNELLKKFLFICTYLDEHYCNTTMKLITRAYKEEYGTPLFTDYDCDSILSINTDSSLLDDFLNQQRENQKEHEYEPYGWIEPDGTYHPVEWGNHAKWAADYLKEYYPYNEYHAMYWKTDSDGTRHNYVNGDMLVYCLGWVLLDSPMQGQARPTYDTSKGLTKAQKEFLYDYYIDYNRHADASALYEERS